MKIVGQILLMSVLFLPAIVVFGLIYGFREFVGCVAQWLERRTQGGEAKCNEG